MHYDSEVLDGLRCRSHRRSAFNLSGKILHKSEQGPFMSICRNCGKELPSPDAECPCCVDAFVSRHATQEGGQRAESVGREISGRTIASLLFGLLSAFMLWIPFLGLPFLLVGYPILALPPFSKTGAHVEYIFISVALKSWVAWSVFTAYFGAIWFAILSLKRK